MACPLKKELFREEISSFFILPAAMGGDLALQRAISYPVFRFYDLYCCGSYHRL
jgi:hypothetical protein